MTTAELYQLGINSKLRCATECRPAWSPPPRDTIPTFSQARVQADQASRVVLYDGLILQLSKQIGQTAMRPAL